MDTPPTLIRPETEGSLEADRRREVSMITGCLVAEMTLLQIHLRDPVNAEKLTVFVKEKLQQAEAACGGTQVFRSNYLDKADPTVLNQLTIELLTGN
jgi:importin-11